ncbi:hypothetical protein [Moorena sp. SIO4A1]|uniref:hypothetical protein n=1 Tax=Moorena sp. SIO4A1 TaxID=2607835 RepID=UPI0025D1C605|nr:hypothetical protein [Moorena sp. SIO4A1]
MRYTGFFTSCLLPLLSSLLPAPNSPRVAYGLSPCSLTPRILYLMTMISAILGILTSESRLLNRSIVDSLWSVKLVS